MDSDQDPIGIEVSPQARKLISALRSKPELLLEVADHFKNGWPTGKLIGPWSLLGDREPAAMCRWLYGFQDTGESQAHGGLAPMVGEGHSGEQWMATVRAVDPEADYGNSLIRRVFDDPMTAAAWIDDQLRSDGRHVVGELDPELVRVREQHDHDREQARAEAELKKRKDDEIPF